MTARVVPSNGTATAERSAAVEIGGMAERVWVGVLVVGLWNLGVFGENVVFFLKQTGGEKVGDSAMLGGLSRQRERGADIVI